MAARCWTRHAASMLLAACCAVSWPAPAAAQGCGNMPCRPPPPKQPHPAMEHAAHGDWQAYAVVFGVNAAIGGLTAGVRQRARGGSFWNGFAAGSAGGGMVFAGKVLSAEHFWGAGLAGRQVAAVGASVIRNASEDVPAFERLMLPLGLVRLYIDRGDSRHPHVKLDLASTGVLAYRMASRDTRLDALSSASTGAPVFLTESGPHNGWHGNNSAGVILLRDRDPRDAGASVTREMVFAHERIHLLQYDHLLHTLSTPTERWLLRRVPGGDWLTRHVDVGLIVVPVLILNGMIPYADRPWEREADFLSGSQ